MPSFCQDGKIIGVVADNLTAENQQGSEPITDFTSHLNPSGTWIDFGSVATDGSVKIQRERDRLLVFPYPRDSQFRVSIRLDALAPAADPRQVQIRALAARTHQSLGPATFTWEDDRLVLTVGTAGAGRYEISW